MSDPGAEPAPPAPARARPGGSWALPIGYAGVTAVGALAILLRDPHVSGSWGVCPSLLLGFLCPGCGGLRGTSELLHGNLAAAWAYNPLVVVGLPLLLAVIARWTLDAARGREPWSPGGASVAVGLVLLLAFTLARNVPAFAPYLGPLAAS